MSNTIKLKRGSGSDPSASDLSVGEVALRTDSGKLFTKKDNGNVAEIGGSGISDGDKGDITVSNSGDTFTIDDDAITTGKISAGAVNDGKLASNAVTNVKVASNAAISLSKLEVIASNKIVGNDSGNAVPKELTPAEVRTIINVEDGATADQTASEIKTLLNSSGLVNAQIDASAAIAGSKISPDFGSQNIVTTGQVQINGTYPLLKLHDSNSENDYSIRNNNGQFMIHDDDRNVSAFSISTAGTGNFPGNLDVGAGLDVTGAITTTGGITLNNSGPRITFTDSNENPDFYIEVNATQFLIQDATNDAQRFRIQSNGVVDIAGNTNFSAGIDVVGEITATSHLDMPDSAIIKLGDSDDLQIYHDGSNSYIRDTDQGNLYIEASAVLFRKNGTTETLAKFVQDDRAELYYDNVEKLETTSSGIDITGEIQTTGHIRVPDNMALIAGTGSDLFIYHDGTDDRIMSSSTNSLIIASKYTRLMNQAGNETLAKFTENGAAELNYDNVKKFETTSAGIDVDGSITCDDIVTAGALLHEGDTNTLVHFDANDQISLKTNGTTRLQVVNAGINVTGNIELSTHLDMPDSAIIKLGTSDDLQIYHSGSESFIADEGTGGITISGGLLSFKNQARDETHATMTVNAGVQLYYDNNLKLQTSAGGVNITGECNATSKFALPDNGKVIFGTGDDLQIYHDGTDSFIDNDNGYLYLNNETSGIRLISGSSWPNGSMAAFYADGAVELYYDNSKKLETTSSGISVTGQLYTTDYIFINNGAHLYLQDNGKARFGTGSDLNIYHDGSHSYIANATNTLYIRSADTYIQDEGGNETNAKFINNGAVELYHDNSKKLETTSGGALVTGNFYLNDNGELTLGTGGDLQIYHDGTNSRIHSPSHNLYIRSGGDFAVFNGGGSETMLLASPNGAVELYYDNSKRLETTSAGVHVLGTLEGDNFKVSNPGNNAVLIQNPSNGIIGFGANNQTNQVVITTAGDLLIPNDSGKMSFGASEDLKIYHDGSVNFIDSPSHELRIRGTYVALQPNGGGEQMALGTANAAFELYYDGSKKFETTSLGTKVTGRINVTGNFEQDDNVKANWGNSHDLQIYHDGSNSVIDNNTGNLYIQSASSILIQGANNENVIKYNANGAVELYYDNSKKFETTSYGISIGQNAAGSISGQAGIEIGQGHTTSEIRLKNTSGGSGSADGFGVQKWSDGNTYIFEYDPNNFVIGTNGVGRWIIGGTSGNLIPYSNNTVDIGTSTTRVRNIYTNDLNLSNEGSSNDVDGTWGSYTIQEGVEDLFLVNKRSGKKYKFNLTEVS